MRRRGFTLVELAIVLVIIGIILGAILKGQELIKNAKIKRLYNQYREIYAAVYTYYDKYDRLPGDDNRASTRWTGAPDGDGNGRIDGSNYLNCAGSTNEEACWLWQHLRLANIIPGSGSDRTNPKHIYGGSIGIVNANFHNLGYKHWIIFQRVPNEVAQLIDEKYDDGNATTGSIIIEQNSYSTNNRKELCFSLD